MTLAKAKACAKAKVKHIYSTGVIYNHHLRSSNFFIVQATVNKLLGLSWNWRHNAFTLTDILATKFIEKIQNNPAYWSATYYGEW